MIARVTLLSCLLLCPVSARAQVDAGDERSALDDAERERGRALVDEAVAAFEAGEYQTALERFRAAYAIAPLEQLRFNIALCYERLARPRDAADEYETLVDAAALDDDARRRAREGLTRLRSRLATLRVIGERGREIHVDGSDRCVVPCELRVDPGRHVVTGASAAPQTLELAEGETAELVAEPIVVPDSYAPGPLLYVGGGLTLLGVAGVIAFGVLALDRHDAFARLPTDAVAQEGSLMRDLSNASIGVASLGAVLVVLDLAIGAL